jgi:hypothetical protein
VQQDHNQPIQLFKQVLASPATLTDAHIDQLQTLLHSFPQCGVLHAIQARTADAEHLTQAAAWFGTSQLLEKVVKTPQILPVITTVAVIVRSRPKPNFLLQQDAIVDQTLQVAGVEPEPEVIKQPAFTAPELQITEVVNKPETQPEVTMPEPSQEPKFAPPIFKQEPFDETQKLIIENIAANDYFVFDKAFADRNQMQPEAIEPAPIAEPTKVPITLAKPAGEDGVTRYHDDKMPYSFLWWLDKTRSKHSQVYQPFANAAVSGNVAFAAPDNHIKDVFEDRSKEEEIVERFIQEEPQIRPQSGDKLDNENKAKHSVEDQEELITETLARIYADQMLYSKAIAAYKILILKNPEKRRYFASQIENLEKKIN